MTFITGRPPSFVVVEFGEELEPCSNTSFPREYVDWACEYADRVWLEIAFLTRAQNVVGIGRLVAASVVPDVELDGRGLKEAGRSERVLKVT